MVCPCLPLWACDVFTEDVLPAHEAVIEYAKNWLKAVHTAHNAADERKVEIDSCHFMERVIATSNERVRK